MKYIMCFLSLIKILKKYKILNICKQRIVLAFSFIDVRVKRKYNIKILNVEIENFICILFYR